MSFPETRWCARLRSASQSLAIVAGSVGVLVLAGGWILNLSSLRSIIPGTASMKVNTALGLMLTASAILIDRSPRQPLRYLVPVCGALLILISAATLFEDVSGWNLGLDEFLISDRTSTRPNRPSPTLTTWLPS